MSGRPNNSFTGSPGLGLASGFVLALAKSALEPCRRQLFLAVVVRCRDIEVGRSIARGCCGVSRGEIPRETVVLFVRGWCALDTVENDSVFCSSMHTRQPYGTFRDTIVCLIETHLHAVSLNGRIFSVFAMQTPPPNPVFEKLRHWRHTVALAYMRRGVLR